MADLITIFRQVSRYCIASQAAARAVAGRHDNERTETAREMLKVAVVRRSDMQRRINVLMTTVGTQRLGAGPFSCSERPGVAKRAQLLDVQRPSRNSGSSAPGGKLRVSAPGPRYDRPQCDADPQQGWVEGLCDAPDHPRRAPEAREQTDGHLRGTRGSSAGGHPCVFLPG